MKLLRRLMILSHRYLGIAISLLVIMWFASGMVMMYAGGMPRLEPELRLERLAAIDFTRVQVSATEAVEKLGFGAADDAGPATLITIMDRPAWRFGGRNGSTVFADDGEIMAELDLAGAQRVATDFTGLPAERVRHVETLQEVDQWTLGQQRSMPLHKFAVDDGAGTEIYIHPPSGDIAMHTTSRTRFWAWLGVIPHWLYFRDLRVNQPLWYDIMVWTSLLACILALMGLVLAITELRRSRQGKLSIPYGGWMRWHYISGAVFGLTTLGFAYSGLLSMEPFAWTQAEGLAIPRNTLTGGPVELARFQRPEAATWNTLAEGRAVKEIELVRILDEPYFVARLASATPAEAERRERLHQPYGVTGRAEDNRLIVHGGTLEPRREIFAVEDIVNRLKARMPDVPILEHELLTEYDNYYYSPLGQTPLPVVRVKFGDPAETWSYIDPALGRVLGEAHRLNRWERWLYSALHNFDFQVLYDYRPAWDIVMLLLCLGGLASSGIGMYLGIRRMRRGAWRALGGIGGAPEPVRPPAE
jgi:hypothetical protein